MMLTGQRAEERFQSLEIGIELLNLLFAVDALQAETPPSPEKRHALQMFLLRSPIYSKSDLAEQAYKDLLSLMHDLTSPENEEVTTSVALQIEDPEAAQLLEFLRAVEKQKEASVEGRLIRHRFPEIPEPARATRALVDRLVALL
jgi:hypothetical protein